MTFEPADSLDDTDWRLLTELQENARISFTELGRRVAMSAPAVAERVRRLEDLGVIRGYRAQVDLERLGWPLLAFVRFREKPDVRRSMTKVIAERPEVLETHHVTGDDCLILKVAARSMRGLEQTASYLARYGSVTTSLVYSTLIDGKTITGLPPADEPAEPPIARRAAAGRERRGASRPRAIG
jgi:Lrp/AsnC family leucine-responsive transcriptional regulator